VLGCALTTFAGLYIAKAWSNQGCWKKKVYGPLILELEAAVINKIPLSPYIMKLNGVAIEAVEVARMKAAARQAQIRTLMELEELMNLGNTSTKMAQHRSSRSMRRSGSVRKSSQDWESRSVSSAPNLATYQHRPRVVDISKATANHNDNDGGSVSAFSFRSESKLSRGDGGSSRRSSYDDDDMSSVGLRSVNSDSRKNSKRRSSLAKALFFGRRKKKSSSGSTTKSTGMEDDDRSTTTSKSRKLFFFPRRNSNNNETADATSVVSDGSLQVRRRRGLFGVGKGRGASTDAASNDDNKSVQSYNSASGSVASMMRRLRRGQAASKKEEEDDERSMDSVSAISTNTQSSEKSSKNKFNIFKFLSKQKKAKKTIQNFEELPTFLIPERVNIPEPEEMINSSSPWQEKKQAAVVKVATPPALLPPLAPKTLVPSNRDVYAVRGGEGSLEVMESRPSLPPLSPKKKKKSKSKQQQLQPQREVVIPVKESREIVFDCHEETKTIDGEDDDGSVFTILSGIIAAWASENAAKKVRDPKSSRSLSFSGDDQRKSCLKADNPVRPYRHSVSFGVISIREYERTVGDNPSVTSGPPISIGWSYMPSFEAAVDEYETSRPCRRTKREFYLPSDLRKDLLLNEWGYTVEEVRRAKREATYIQYHREKSAYQGLLSEKAQELAESTRRKVNRLRNGNNTKKEQEKLWDQAQERLGVLSKPPSTTLLVSPADDMMMMDDDMQY
jgi:hypothetical protein